MVRVQTGSRLHFGVLNLDASMTRDAEAIASRWFGGVGLMIAQPALRLRVEPASVWSAEGPLAARALAFAERFTASTRQEERLDHLSPHAIHVESAMPEHAGLGSGTQLGLAVATALARSWNLDCDPTLLAQRIGRGARSALGVRGFARGGLLVEAGKPSPHSLAPLVAHQLFPNSWRVVLIRPALSLETTGLHGGSEVAAFAQMAAQPSLPGRTEALCRLVLLGLLPALVEQDANAFGEALYEFNARVGEAFAPVQGGPYASRRVAELVAFVRGEGVRGVGQSSWGPTVFAVCADDERAERLTASLRARFPTEETLIASALNRGAEWTAEEHG